MTSTRTEYDKRWREANAERRAAYRAATRKQQGRIIKDAKDRPCMDCGESFPHYVMDFDHNGSEKSFSIAMSIGRVSTDRLRAEIAKCDVVCANCHRIRTHS